MSLQANELLANVDHILLHNDAKYEHVRALVHSTVPRVAQDVCTACLHASSDGKAIQLLFGQIGSGQLPKALAKILGRLLSALKIPQMCDFTYYDCTLRVSAALEWLLIMHSYWTQSVSLRFSLAKQLQQAELLQPLHAALERLAAFFSVVVKQAACASGGVAAWPCSYTGSKKTVVIYEQRPDDRLPVLARKMAVQLLQMTVRLCYLWPGGVLKSAAARPLLPVIAEVAAVDAQLSAELYRQKPDGIKAQEAMIAVMSATCLLIKTHIAVTEDPFLRSLAAQASRHGDSSFCKLPEFRQLLKSVLAALAELQLRCVKDEEPEPRCHAVQQLWLALGYDRGQLAQAASILEACRLTVTGSDTSTNTDNLPAASAMKKLVHVLGEIWEQLAQDNTVCVASFDMADMMYQWLHEESSQMVLLMRVAEYMFLNGPEGVCGDLDLLTATVSCLRSYFSAAARWYSNIAKQEDELASAGLLVHDLVPLLLQFQQYGKEAAQQQQQITLKDSSDSGGDSASPADHYKLLQQAVIAALLKLIRFTTSVAKQGDSSLLDTWLAWGPHVTHIIEELLREFVAAAACSASILSNLQQLIEPCAGAWLQVVIPSGSSLDALQQYSSGLNLAVSCKQVAYTAVVIRDASSCHRGHSRVDDNSKYDTSAPSCSNTTPTAARSAAYVSSPGDQALPGQAECCPDSQAGAVRSCQAGPTPSELRLLSLMTSCCKALMQTVQLDCAVSMPLLQAEASAVGLLSITAAAVSYQAQQMAYQSLQHPVMRPWLSLLGRCLVMMGQRLELIKDNTSNKHIITQSKTLSQAALQQQQSQLRTVQMLQLQAAEQLTTLQRANEECSADMTKLRSQVKHCCATQQHRNMRQLLRLLHMELQARESTLQKTQNQQTAVTSSLQTLIDQQKQLEQDISKTEAELQLLAGVSSQSVAQMLFDLGSGINALLFAFKVLAECCSQCKTTQQMQQQYAAKHTSTHAAAAYRLLRAIMRRLFRKLLPTLSVAQSLCHDQLLSNEFSSIVVSGECSSSAVAWLQHSAETVSKSSSCTIEWQQDLRTLGESQTAVQAAAAEKAGDKNQLHTQLLSSKPYQQLHEQLVAIGSELITALPHCWCCNNPGCDSLSADSELQLTSGRCAGCTGGSTDKDIRLIAARYCSVECQKQHWKQHKKVCMKLHKQLKQRGQQQ